MQPQTIHYFAAHARLRKVPGLLCPVEYALQRAASEDDMQEDVLSNHIKICLPFHHSTAVPTPS